MSYRELNNEEKAYYRKRLGWNVLQLFFGTILLVVAYIHLQGNTAEKMSLSSGVEVLGQKISLRFHNVFDNNGTQYQARIAMDKNYAEVINVVQNSSCKEKVDLPSLLHEYSLLQADSLAEYTKKSTDYDKFLIDFYRKVSDVCKAEVHTQQ